MEKGTRVKILENISPVDGEKYHFLDIGSTAVVVTVSHHDNSVEVIGKRRTQQTLYIGHVKQV